MSWTMLKFRSCSTVAVGVHRTMSRVTIVIRECTMYVDKEGRRRGDERKREGGRERERLEGEGRSGKRRD